MFLFDPAVATNFEAAQTEMNRLMERAGARVITCNKWDERRLAYEIKGRKRGLYVLTYFEVETGKIRDLERDVQLSDAVLRCLLVKADHLTEDEMKEIAATPAHETSDEDQPRSRSREESGEREARSQGENKSEASDSNDNKDAEPSER
jgi:small subunit ribosomal protein S6